MTEALRKFYELHPNYNRDRLRKRRKEKPDSAAKSSREYRRRNPELNYKKARKWIIANPHAVRAYQAVHAAIKSGILIRESCSACGNPRTQGHHSDYTKPLKVVWLCALHHKERHIKS